jgi:DNA primase
MSYSLSEISGLFSTPLRKSGKQYKTNCPFKTVHDDKTPSFFVNLETGWYKCYGCGATGQLSDLGATLTNYKNSFTDIEPKKRNLWIPDLVVNGYADILWKNEEILKLIKTRVPDEKVIREFKLGYHPEFNRFTIPIYDREGICRNLKLISFINPIKHINFGKGWGMPRLFGIDALKKDKVIICAGEFDCLVLRCFSFPSITGTAGEGTWEEDWNEEFSNKEVYIVYDQDDAGRKGANNVATSLYHYAQKVYIVDFDIEIGNGFDTTDYFLKEKRTRDDFRKCLKNAKLFTMSNHSFSIFKS